jgi:hypothetical protein
MHRSLRKISNNATVNFNLFFNRRCDSDNQPLLNNALTVLREENYIHNAIKVVFSCPWHWKTTKSESQNRLKSMRQARVIIKL